MLAVAIRKTLPDFELAFEFTLENGIIVLCGQSGLGMTTLLDCIAGLTAPDSGAIVLNGWTFYSSTEQINIPARERKVGYVFRDRALFPHMTVKQNVMYGTEGYRAKGRKYNFLVSDILDQLKITHLQDRYPAQLGSGEQQRVALARALLAEPDLLLLDEPLWAVDDMTRVQLRRELKALQRQYRMPFLMVTQNRAEIKYLADRVIFPAGGKQYHQVIIPISGKGGGGDARNNHC